MQHPSIVSPHDWGVLQKHWKECEKTMFDPNGDFDMEMHRPISLVNLLPGVVSIFCCSSHPEDKDDPANTMTLMLACRDKRGLDIVHDLYQRIWEGHDELTHNSAVPSYDNRVHWELSLGRKMLPLAPWTYYHPMILRAHNIKTNDVRDSVIYILEMALCSVALGFDHF